MRRGLWLVLLLAGMLGLLLAGCTGRGGQGGEPAGGGAPQGAQKPAQLKVALVDFMSGPAAVFGEASLNAGKMLLDQFNEQGGIGGVPVRYIVVDEAGTVDKQVSEFRRLVLDEKVDVVVGYTSSSNCLGVAPVAEELEVLTIVHICGTHRLFEDNQFKWVFRTSAHQMSDNISAALYVLQMKPDLKTIAGINPDYAWGRDSWEAFKRAILKLKPDVQVVDELWPKLYQGDYAAEISKLLAERPDVIHTSLWGGDLDTFIKQAAPRGLFERSTVVMTSGETSMETVGPDIPPGVFMSGRGEYLLFPDPQTNPLRKKFIDDYIARYGKFPTYPAFRMAQALFALKAAYEKALAIKGSWPTKQDVANALVNLGLDTPTGYIFIGEDHQARQSAVWGITTDQIHPQFKFPLLSDLRMFPAELVNPPVGIKSLDWIDSWPSGQ